MPLLVSVNKKRALRNIPKVNRNFSMNGWFGDSRRHSLAALGVKTGRKRRNIDSLRFLNKNESKSSKAVSSKYSIGSGDINHGSLANSPKVMQFKKYQESNDDLIEKRLDEKEKIANQLFRDGRMSRHSHDAVIGDINQKRMSLLKNANMYQYSKPKPKKYMVYNPAFVSADLPLIAGDAVGTAGAAVVSLIPVAVAAGAIYGGAVLTKKAYEKTSGKKFSKKLKPKPKVKKK